LSFSNVLEHFELKIWKYFKILDIFIKDYNSFLQIKGKSF
jgi:hypothetical protein